jgi:hypothetical protein
MEYAAGGELFERISTVGRFKEDEVRTRLITIDHVSVRQPENGSIAYAEVFDHCPRSYL